MAGAFYHNVYCKTNQRGTPMRLRTTLTAAAALLAVWLPGPLAVAANNLDLSTVKCKDFLSSGKDNVAVIITWLDGYYKEENDPPVIDFDSFGKNTENLAKFCKDSPDTGLITAADQTFGKKKKK